MDMIVMVLIKVWTEVISVLGTKVDILLDRGGIVDDSKVTVDDFWWVVVEEVVEINVIVVSKSESYQKLTHKQ